MFNKITEGDQNFIRKRELQLASVAKSFELESSSEQKEFYLNKKAVSVLNVIFQKYLNNKKLTELLGKINNEEVKTKLREALNACDILEQRELIKEALKLAREEGKTIKKALGMTGFFGLGGQDALKLRALNLIVPDEVGYISAEHLVNFYKEEFDPDFDVGKNFVYRFIVNRSRTARATENPDEFDYDAFLPRIEGENSTEIESKILEEDYLQQKVPITAFETAGSVGLAVSALVFPPSGFLAAGMLALQGANIGSSIWDFFKMSQKDIRIEEVKLIEKYRKELNQSIKEKLTNLNIFLQNLKNQESFGIQADQLQKLRYNLIALDIKNLLNEENHALVNSPNGLMPNIQELLAQGNKFSTQNNQETQISEQLNSLIQAINSDYQEKGLEKVTEDSLKQEAKENYKTAKIKIFGEEKDWKIGNFELTNKRFIRNAIAITRIASSLATIWGVAHKLEGGQTAQEAVQNLSQTQSSAESVSETLSETVVENLAENSAGELVQTATELVSENTGNLPEGFSSVGKITEWNPNLYLPESDYFNAEFVIANPDYFFSDSLHGNLYHALVSSGMDTLDAEAKVVELLRQGAGGYLDSGGNFVSIIPGINDTLVPAGAELIVNDQIAENVLGSNAESLLNLTPEIATATPTVPTTPDLSPVSPGPVPRPETLEPPKQIPSWLLPAGLAVLAGGVLWWQRDNIKEIGESFRDAYEKGVNGSNDSSVLYSPKTELRKAPIKPTNPQPTTAPPTTASLRGSKKDLAKTEPDESKESVKSELTNTADGELSSILTCLENNNSEAIKNILYTKLPAKFHSIIDTLNIETQPGWVCQSVSDNKIIIGTDPLPAKIGNNLIFGGEQMNQNETKLYQIIHEVCHKITAFYQKELKDFSVTDIVASMRNGETGASALGSLSFYSDNRDGLTLSQKQTEDITEVLTMYFYDRTKLKKHLQFLASKNPSDIQEKKTLGLVEYVSQDTGNALIELLDVFVEDRVSKTPNSKQNTNENNFEIRNTTIPALNKNLPLYQQTDASQCGPCSVMNILSLYNQANKNNIPDMRQRFYQERINLGREPEEGLDKFWFNILEIQTALTESLNLQAGEYKCLCKSSNNSFFYDKNHREAEVARFDQNSISEYNTAVVNTGGHYVVFVKKPNNNLWIKIDSLNLSDQTEIPNPLSLVPANADVFLIKKAVDSNTPPDSDSAHNTPNTPQTENIPANPNFETSAVEDINSPIYDKAGYKLQVYHNGEPSLNASEAIKQSSELAIGDMHGSLLKFLDTLVLGGFVEVKDASKLQYLREFCHFYSTFRSMFGSLVYDKTQLRYSKKAITDILANIKSALDNNLLYFNNSNKRSLFDGLISEVKSKTDQNNEYLIQRNPDGSIKSGEIKSGETEYDPLFKILQGFFALSSRVFEKTLDEAISEIKPKNTNKILTLIGDEICDRGIGDDLAMMKIVEKLREKGLEVEVTASNHLVHGLFLAQNDLSIVFGDDNTGRRQSASGLQAIFRVGQKEYKETLLEYVQGVDMFRYDSVNKIFYSHAPITPIQIQQLLDILETKGLIAQDIGYNDLGEGKKMSIEGFVEKANQHFKQVCQNYLQNNSDANYNDLMSLYEIVSTRSPYQDIKNIPFNNQGVKIVHGHDDSSQTSPYNGQSIFNLDNRAQKGTSPSEYNTHFESPYFALFKPASKTIQQKPQATVTHPTTPSEPAKKNNRYHRS